MALKRYRLKIYDGAYEVLHKARFYVDVDLDSMTRNSILDRQLVALVELGRIANEPMTQPIMKVCDHDNGATILDWIA
jgi:hypothetical protein